MHALNSLASEQGDTMHILAFSSTTSSPVCLFLLLSPPIAILLRGANCLSLNNVEKKLGHPSCLVVHYAPASNLAC